MMRFTLVYLTVLHFPVIIYSSKSYSDPGTLVYPLLFETRSANGERTVHLSDGNFVHLHKATVLHDTLTVHSFEKNKRIVQTIEAKDIEGNLYENKRTLASLLLEETAHGIVMEGLINHTYRIQPLFEAERSESGQIAHKLYVVTPHKVNFIESIPEFDSFPEDVKAEARSELPSVFRPDVFLISDYEHNRHFSALTKLVNYLVVLFNGVKLRYESVRYLRIIPRLVGVECAQRGYDSYEVMHGNSMVAENTLKNLQSYVEGRLNDFRGADAVMLITGHSMISVSTGQIRTGVAGLAMTGGLCSRRRVAESLDVGRGYAGIVHLAHELAHLMGSSHDQAPPVPGIPGNQGAYHCRWSDGHIMSYDLKDENQFTFSYCSQEQFVVFLRLVPQRCIENTWTGKLPKNSSRFPGDTMSRNKFCRRESGSPKSKECTKRSGDHLCKITCCPGKDRYRRNVDVAEYWCLDGTNCGKNKECYNGYCTTKRKK
ncbi:venom metalloproteinase antarease-like TtrivMP_A isoform X1 [Dermacentor silvarum]|uniref:venom metalloproteinase antarease-like TtrivMP_A isoform X3 n=1 Tax=Dermacentor silvarum TaxID=543639 RepID=UPI00189826C6|nr:venom metalloproteinase antarease-like TtrivMP_A isoform X3 [Dermacentor silvarum]XP_037581127.1 venom metalloproteinase antarease-like TtrivMP_A isoform X1 [Dermacentor silvarum]